MTGPLVSVIIPVSNGERYLAEAIDSVLAQTWRPIELIVLDDGSTDGSAAIARRYASPVRYCYQPNAGLASARNEGVLLAHGDFIAYLDSDDIWVPDKLTRQMAVFSENRTLDIVFGHIQQFRSPKLPLVTASGIHVNGTPMPGYSAGAMLIKRGSFFHVGLFDKVWRIGEFVDWYLRAMEKGMRSFLLPDVVMWRRIHSDNMGIRDRRHRKDYLHILKSALERRRRRDAAWESDLSER